MRYRLLPTARSTDPRSSHTAARIVEPGNDDLIAAIHAVLSARGPLTAFDIATNILAYTERWDEGSIRSACARAGLRKLPDLSKSPRGNACSVYALPLKKRRWRLK